MGNLTLKELGRRAFETAKAKGFHDEPIDIPRALMLTVSELAEALEADRKNKRADLSAFFDKEPCEIFPFREKFEVHVKDTFEDELADATIRLLDLIHRTRHQSRNARSAENAVQRGPRI